MYTQSLVTNQFNISMYVPSSIILDAIRLISNIKRTPANAASLKMAHFSNIGVTEVFLEATPSTFITTILLFSAVYENQGLSVVLFGTDLLSNVIFHVGYAASILSSAFGVSR